MASQMEVVVLQEGATASVGEVREHSVTIDRPLKVDGTDQRAMGSELLRVSLGGCFISTFLPAARASERPAA